MAAGTALIKLIGDVDGFTKSLNEGQKRLNRFGQALAVAGARATASFTIPIVAAGTAVLKFGGDFETAMAKIKKTVGPGNADLQQLKETMISLSKETTFGAAELAEFARLGAQLGVGTSDNMQKNTTDIIAFTRAISDLAIAANELPAEQAAKGVAKLISVAGEDISKDVSRVTNTIALLGDTLPTSEERILNFSVLLSGLAKTAKLGTAEILGIAGGFASVVNGTERAASSVQKLTSELVGAIKSGGPELEEFARIMGTTGEAIQETFGKDIKEGGGLGPIIQDFLFGLKRLSEEGENTFAVLEKIGLGNVKTQQTFLSGAGGVELFARSFENATENSLRFTKAQNEVQVMMATVQAKIAVLKNKLVEVFIRLFDAFEPQIRKIIDVLSDFADKLIESAKDADSWGNGIKTAIVAVLGSLALLGPALFALGSFITTIVGLAVAFNGLNTILKLTLAGLSGVGKAAATTSSAMSPLLAGSTATSSIINPTLWQALKTSLAGLGPIFTKIAAGFKAMVSTGALISGIFTGIVAAAGSLLGLAIGTFINDAAQEFRVLNGTIEEAEESFGLWESAVSLAPDLFGKLVDGLKSAGSAIVRVGGELATLAVIMTKDMAVALFDMAKNTTSAVLEFALGSEIFKTFSNAVSNVVKTIKEGIGGAADFIVSGFDAVSGVIFQATTATSEFAKASDESKKAFFDFIKSNKEGTNEVVNLAEAQKESAAAAELNRVAAEEAAEALKKYNKEVASLREGFEKLTQSGIAKELEKTFDAISGGDVGLIEQLPLSTLMEIIEEAIPVIGLLSDEAVQKLGQMMTRVQDWKDGVKAAIPLNDAFWNSVNAPDISPADFSKVFADLDKEFKNLPAFGGEDTFGRPGLSLKQQIQTGALSGMLGTGGLGGIPSGAKEATNEIDKLGESLQKLSSFGEIFKGTFGTIVSSLGTFTSGIGALKDAGGIGGLISGITSPTKEDGSQGGIIDMIGGIASAIPVVGALVGPALQLGTALFKAFTSSPVEKIMKKIGSTLGVEISEALAEQIAETMEKEGVGQFEAILLNLSSIIDEVGVDSNIEGFTKQFNDLLNAVELGAVDAAKGLAEIDKVFPQLVEGFKKMGFAGQVEIGKLVNRMQELGTESEALQEHIKATAQELIDNFTPVLDLLEKQMGDGGIFSEGEKSIEAANTNLALLIATFGAAIQAAGGLGGAIALLPESFEQLINKFRELLGEENQALNALTRFYNFAKENQEVLAAIDGIIAGMGSMAELGILNAQNINAMTAAALLQMNELLNSTNDQTTALQAMGPQIGQLLAMYEKLGLEVPPELQEIADKARAAGASLEPPEGIIDILAEIRDIMLEVASAFGVAAKKAGDFGSAARGSGGAGPPDAPGGGDRTSRGAAEGFEGTVTGPKTFFIEPGKTEDVSIGEPGTNTGGISIGNISLAMPDGVTDPQQFATAFIRALRDDPEVQTETQKVANA